MPHPVFEASVYMSSSVGIWIQDRPFHDPNCVAQGGSKGAGQVCRPPTANRPDQRPCCRLGPCRRCWCRPHYNTAHRGTPSDTRDRRCRSPRPQLAYTAASRESRSPRRPATGRRLGDPPPRRLRATSRHRPSTGNPRGRRCRAARSAGCPTRSWDRSSRRARWPPPPSAARPAWLVLRLCPMGGASRASNHVKR